VFTTCSSLAPQIVNMAELAAFGYTVASSISEFVDVGCAEELPPERRADKKDDLLVNETGSCSARYIPARPSMIARQTWPQSRPHCE
jgi:hypothetical protein